MQIIRVTSARGCWILIALAHCLTKSKQTFDIRRNQHHLYLTLQAADSYSLHALYCRVEIARFPQTFKCHHNKIDLCYICHTYVILPTKRKSRTYVIKVYGNQKNHGMHKQEQINVSTQSNNPGPKGTATQRRRYERLARQKGCTNNSNSKRTSAGNKRHQSYAINTQNTRKLIN